MIHFRQIYIEITNVCNLSCAFCIQNHQDKRYLSIDEFKHIINEIKPYTDYVYLHILGEPLIHPQLEEILKILNDNNININITTNGTLLLDKLDLLLKYKIRQINISVHSVLNDKDKNTYLDNIFKASDLLAEKTYISYRLWCLKDKKLDKEAIEVLNIIKDYYQIKEIKNNTLKKNVFISFEEVFSWPKMSDAELSINSKCRGLVDMLGILSNGEVVPCCLDAYNEISLGNIFKTSLNDILHSKLALDIHQGFKNHQAIHPLCKRCKYRLRFKKGSKA